MEDNQSPWRNSQLMQQDLDQQFVVAQDLNRKLEGKVERELTNNMRVE